MASTQFYMKFFHREWLSSQTVMLMDATARGIYIHLIAHQFEDGQLPVQTELLQRLAACTPKEWKSFEPWLEQCFPVDGDVRRNRKVSEQRGEETAKRETNAANGSLGGRPKKNRTVSKKKPNGSEKKTERLPDEKPNGSTSNSKSKSVTDVTPPSSPPGDEKSDGSDCTLDGIPVVALLEDEGPSLDNWWQRFLEVYPKRSGDKRAGEARKKFDRQVKHDKADPAEVVAGAERYRDWCDAVGNTGTPMVKQMSTFMNQLGWQEEWNIPESKRPAQKSESQGVVNHLTGFRGTE